MMLRDRISTCMVHLSGFPQDKFRYYSLQFVDIEAKKKRDRDALARGEKLEDDDEKYEPYGKEDAGLQGGILIPLAPFGIPKFDNGERFDLKACVPYQRYVGTLFLSS